MNWNRWIRQIHRWMSVALTMLVIANIVVMVRGGQREPDVLTYSPLLPLALLLLSGWYLLVLPYLAKRRRGNGGGHPMKTRGKRRLQPDTLGAQEPGFESPGREAV